MNIHAEVESKVIDVIRRELRASEHKLEAGTRLNDLSADSLALIKLTLTFEEAFDIEIPDDEADMIRTVEDAVITVERYVRARPPG
jgi:acyl carrier protein